MDYTIIKMGVMRLGELPFYPHNKSLCLGEFLIICFSDYDTI